MVLLAMGVQTCRLHSDSLQSWPYCGRVSLSRPLALVSPSGSPATVVVRPCRIRTNPDSARALNMCRMGPGFSPWSWARSGTEGSASPGADWIFQASAREHDLDASIAASPQRWWGTPRYRDRIAVGDRVWMQETGPHHPGIYYVATIMSATYEHPAHPGEPAYARWRTDIRVDYRITPPLLRSELLDDATLGSFRP
jgi:hypothetical protein